MSSGVEPWLDQYSTGSKQICIPDVRKLLGTNLWKRAKLNCFLPARPFFFKKNESLEEEAIELL